MTFYTDRFIPKGAAGCARGPVILIRPKYMGDVGLLRHEQVHRWQWILTLSVHSFLYLLIKRYRLWAEVMAYKRQLKYPPANKRDIYRRKYAHYVATGYKLKVTEADVYLRLG